MLAQKLFSRQDGFISSLAQYSNVVGIFRMGVFG